MKKIIENASQNSDRIAIVCDDQSISYSNFIYISHALSLEIRKYCHENSTCVILLKKSIQLYQSMLACFLSNCIYVPINLSASVDRNRFIINEACPSLIITDYYNLNIINEYLPELKSTKILIIKNGECDDVNSKFFDLPIYYYNSNFFTDNTFNHGVLNHIDLNSIAYLFFTSGSTGAPKGVPISFRNLNAYILAAINTFQFSSDDRFSQISDISFDLSLHEILLSLTSSATLYVYTESHLLGVAYFISKFKITQSMLVPSSIPVIFEQAKYFKITLPSLKQSFFCGELFPINYARLWSGLANRAQIINLYGPTEATIACTYYSYDSMIDDSNLSALPIGRPFHDVTIRVTENDEIVISGEQVFSGYWKQDQLENYQYYTGDIVSYHKDYGYLYRSRVDDQWQIKGYRIEKNEVESFFRQLMNKEEIFVVPKYNQAGLANKLVVFFSSNCHLTAVDQLNRNSFNLMFEFEYIALDEFPRLPNQKINYQALFRIANQ